MEKPWNSMEPSIVVNWWPTSYRGLPGGGSTGPGGGLSRWVDTHPPRQPHCLPRPLASHLDPLRRHRLGPSTLIRCSPSSTSSACSGTRSWSVALWGGARGRSQYDDDESGSGWSEILSRAPASETVCTSDASSLARTRCLKHPHQHIITIHSN